MTDIIIDQAINEMTKAFAKAGASGTTGSASGLGDFFGGILSTIGGFLGLAEGGLVKKRGVFELAEDEPEFVIPVSKLPKFVERFQEKAQNAFPPAPSRFLDFPELATPGFNLEPASFSPVSFPRIPEPTPDSMANLDRIVASVSPDGRGHDGGFDDGPAVKVNMTVVTPDANSFRRSQAQISSDLSRAVDRGMRGR